MPYENEFSCRLVSPVKDAPTRRKNGAREHNGKKYDVIYQQQRGKWVDQSYRYPKETWTASEAKSHCKSHEGSYEGKVDIEEMDAMVTEVVEETPETNMNEGTILYRLASRVFNTPLAITPDKLAVIMSVLGKRIGIDAELKTLSVYDPANVEARKVENVALIPIHGTLVHRAMGLEAMSGLTSYASLSNLIQQAAEDEAIEHILLDIDSPGGEVSGLFDLVDLIYSLRDKKHIVAYANEHAYSAAYAIASAAHEVYTSRTGGVGSIGVIAVHVDQSAFDEKMGFKYTSIYAGKKKNDLSPHAPLSEEATTELQDRVDEVYDLFVNTVSRNRDITADEIKKTEADFYLGSKGLEIGLVDDLRTFDQTIKDLTQPKGEGNMSDTKDLESQLDVLLADSPREERDIVLEKMGYVSQDKAKAKKGGDVDVEAIKKEAQKEKTEMEKVVRGLQTEVGALKGRVEKAEADADKERKARRRIELHSEVESYGCVGDGDVFVDTAIALEATDAEAAQKYLAELKVQGDALKASGIFTEIGDSGEGVISKSAAYKELESKVQELVSKEEMSATQAWREVPRRFPELYKKYREGR